MNSRKSAITGWLTSIFVFVVGLALARASVAGEWPQILGPQRNGAADDEKIAAAFPADGPRIAWKHRVGEGYAGVAVAQGIVVVFHRVGDSDVVEGLESASGKPLWKQKFAASYSGGINSDHGPRAVPLIHDGAIYLYSSGAELHSVELKTGKVRWSRELAKEYKLPNSFFGAGSTPIVAGELLLVNVGGRDGAGIVAFNLKDGKTAWKSTDEQASYSSPVMTTVDGAPQVIFVTRLNTVAVEPQGGKRLWAFPYGDRGPTVNAATPQVLDGRLFLTASYGIGAVSRKIGATSSQEIWANNNTMSSQFCTPVPYQGKLFGIDGRQDSPPSRLRCFDPKTGTIDWTEQNFPIGHLIVADQKLIIVTDDGELILAKASAKRYEELARARLSESITRALPALSNSKLYVRDSDTLRCVELSPGR